MFCVVAISFSLHAQRVEVIQGVVRSDAGKVARASVSLLSVQDSSILSYSYTDSEGNFSLRIDTQRYPRAILSVRCLGYRSHTQAEQLSVGRKLEVLLQGDTRKLQEVVVHAPKVWGSSDTINYNVSRLLRSSDRSIGDVIARIPGMRRQGNAFEYQGKPLKQVNIEGIDLSQGNYGVITSNIDASDIATIQVLDNHQSIRSLVGKRSSDDVVVNLKLSPKKRGVWGGAVDLGLGYGHGLETNSRLRGNYFSRKSQHLGVAYIDNSGRQDYQSLGNAQRSRPSQEPSILSQVERPSPPNLPPSYYVDNLTHSLTGNSAFVLEDSSHLHLQGSYRYDRLVSEGSTRSFYDEGASPIILDERIHHLSRKYGVSAGMSYEKNLQSYYLRDRLKVLLDQNNTTGSVSLGEKMHPQSHKYEGFRLENQVHYINPSIRIPLEFILSQRVDASQEDFTASNSSHLEDQIPPRYRGSPLVQEGKLFSISLDNRLQIPIIKLSGRWQYLPQLTLSYQYQRLSSELWGNSSRGHDNILRSSIVQTLSYVHRDRSWDIILPLSYQIRSTSHDRLSGLLFEPQFKLKLNLGTHWGIDLSGKYTHSEPSIRVWYPYTILRDYRSLTTGTPKLFREHTTTIGVLLNYRSIFSFFSSSLRLNYSTTHKPFVNMLRINSKGGTYQLLSHEHRYKNFSGLWSLSKGFLWWGAGIDLDLGYVYNSGVVASQGNIGPYDSQLSSVRLSLKLNPSKYVLIDYEIFYGRNRTKSLSYARDVDNLFSQTARLGFTLFKHLYANVVLEHSYLHSTGEKTHATLLSNELTWKLGKLDISCELNNVLGNKYYHSVRRLSYATIESDYQLRPRAVLLRISSKL